MRLLVGTALSDAIKRVASGNNVSCAVAFWGSGADGTIGAVRQRTVRIICNLDTGGTNPEAIVELMRAGAQVRQHDRLHAKVYIADKEAIVTSANASTNGLGIEGSALAHWIETGVIIPTSEAVGWFDALWEKSRPIFAHDLKRARPRFAYHKAPGLNPIDDFPLVTWSGDVDWDFDRDAIRDETGDEYAKFDEILETGIEVEVSNDRTLFTNGRWVLWWNPRNKDGYPKLHSKPWWSCTSGRFVKKGIRLTTGQSRDYALPKLDPPPPPFSPDDKRFRRVFHEVIARDEFASLRQLSYRGSFFRPRLERMREFWEDLRAAYAKSLP